MYTHMKCLTVAVTHYVLHYFQARVPTDSTSMPVATNADDSNGVAVEFASDFVAGLVGGKT